jgi:hypothetical protein
MQPEQLIPEPPTERTAGRRDGGAEGMRIKRCECELVGIHEVAAMAGVTSSAVSNWIARYTDFPEPVAELHCGRIYTRAEVQRWLKLRSTRAIV